MGEERIGELVDKSKEIFQPRDKEMNDLREKKKKTKQNRSSGN